MIPRRICQAVVANGTHVGHHAPLSRVFHHLLPRQSVGTTVVSGDNPYLYRPNAVAGSRTTTLRQRACAQALFSANRRFAQERAFVDALLQ